MKIHSKQGKGFKEVVYKNAMEIEFINSQIPYEKEKSFNIEHDGTILKHCPSKESFASISSN